MTVIFSKIDKIGNDYSFFLRIPVEMKKNHLSLLSANKDSGRVNEKILQIAIQ